MKTLHWQPGAPDLLTLGLNHPEDRFMAAVIIHEAPMRIATAADLEVEDVAPILEALARHFLYTMQDERERRAVARMWSQAMLRALGRRTAPDAD